MTPVPFNCHHEDMGALDLGNNIELLWWSAASLRISHPALDPFEAAQKLGSTPSIAQRPGESKVPHGDCRSAGYLCFSNRADHPARPNEVFEWAEAFVLQREPVFRELLNKGCDINVYVGIHTNTLAIGFNLPAMPTLWSLKIVVGVEVFSG